MVLGRLRKYEKKKKFWKRMRFEGKGKKIPGERALKISLPLPLSIVKVIIWEE